MLQFVDTAIGFSVVMLMLSLLITAIVQAVSAALDLRGRNLAKHIEMLLYQVYPGFDKTLDALYQKALVDAQKGTGPKTVLNEPTRKEKDKKAGEVIAGVMVNHPALAQGAKGITWFARRANAVSSEELIAALKDLASSPASKLESNAKRVLQECLNESVDRIGEKFAFLSALDDAVAKVDPQIRDRVKTLITQVSAGMTLKVTRLERGVEQWFDTVMSRSSDLFQRYTRAITVGVAVVLAVFLQIDARQIAQELYTNAEIRNSFVKTVDDITARADKVLANSNRGSQAAQLLAGEEKEELLKSRTAHDTAEPNSDAAKKADAQMISHQGAANLLATAPTDLNNCSAADTWLAAQPGGTQELRAKLQQTCQGVTQDAIGIAGKQIREISDKLQQSDLKIMSWGDSYWGSYANFYHVLGILATIVLLSLGAPFWFNMLREVANLKPAIATKLSQQETEEEAPAETRITTITAKARKAAA